MAVKSAEYLWHKLSSHACFISIDDKLNVTVFTMFGDSSLANYFIKYKILLILSNFFTIFPIWEQLIALAKSGKSML